jgi:hypothetical protein
MGGRVGRRLEREAREGEARHFKSFFRGTG